MCGFEFGEIQFLWFFEFHKSTFEKVKKQNLILKSTEIN